MFIKQKMIENNITDVHNLLADVKAKLRGLAVEVANTQLFQLKLLLQLL